MESSSSEESGDLQKQLPKRFIRHGKRRYGQRIPKELSNLRAQANNKYVFGEIEETKRILEVMIQKYPFFQESYRIYGLICLDQNKLQNATNYFMLAAKRKGSAQLWLKIANLLKSQDRHDLASLYFGKVLKKNPTNIQLMWERVGCFEHCGEYSKAIQQLTKLEQIAASLGLDQVRDESMKRMAKIFVKKNQLTEAKECLMKITLNDHTTNMMCEILELEKNFGDMRALLDKVFGNKKMNQILVEHDFKIICFYVLCGFNDYRQIVDYYKNNMPAINHLLDLTEKLQESEGESLLEILYVYRGSFDKEVKEKLLLKHSNYVKQGDKPPEVPDDPEQINNKDQIIFIYKKILATQDPALVTKYFLKILSYEQKSVQKQQQILAIRKDEGSYLFGKMRVKRRTKLSMLSLQNKSKSQQSISVCIGHVKFFELANKVFKLLLETGNSQYLFEVTYKMYQLRLKKIAKQQEDYNTFMEDLANYGIWAALMQKQYLIAPIYFRYLKSKYYLLHLIQIIQRNITPEQRQIVNSFTRCSTDFDKSVLTKNLNKLKSMQEDNPGDPLLNLLISLKNLQIMTGRLAENQEKWMKQTLFYFDKYRFHSTDQLEVQYNLARIYLHINIFSKGIELLEDLLEKNVKHPVMEKAAFCLMQIHKRMGNSNQAFYYLRKYNTFD